MKTVMIDKKATAKRLKKMFLECGIKPEDVKEALQFESVQAVYKWLNPNNKTLPSIDSIVQLAHLMNCPLDDILVTKEIEIR
ncbi:MAG: helix-turn-helix domain-containing protein [Lachnospiraceae bacterium]|nr:helix-turn-helix domain-containing protein [Lachnospiraceae bacterium]